MSFLSRLRRPGTRQAGAVALTVALAVLMAACGQDHPDSIFHHRTDFNRDVDSLFRLLIWAGTAVFVIVEGILVYALVRFRARPGQPEPEHVHGNTTLEITWTVIPLLLLIVIAIPTIRTISKTEAPARSDALQVEVIGHQWWWEFRYPQYHVVTANELYLPIGRTVNFTLHSADVIHSFWVPGLAGKRDVVSNHTNYLWYTPDSTGESVFNGACAEYCGTNHANMRFKAFTVSSEEFESWAKHQAEAAAPPPGMAPPATPVAPTPGNVTASGTATSVASVMKTSGPAAPAAAAPARPAVTQEGFIAFPREKIPDYAVPKTPYPAGLTFDDNLLAGGNAANGAKLMAGVGTCLACHTIAGNPMMIGIIGPNLTHVASRTTIAAGLYPNDAQHLARWIKNARRTKPDILMPTLGIGEYDPTLKTTMKTGLTDQQIADIVAYLQTLK
jgi:cytochrome c oxidase subunit 2